MKNIKLFSIVFSLLLFTSSPTPLQGLIVSSTGDTNVITPTGSTVVTDLDGTQVFAFDELQNVTLSSAISVDDVVPAPGASAITYDDPGDLSSGTLTASTIVSSHFVTVKAAGLPNETFNYTGTITFSDEIVAFQAYNATFSSNASQIDLSGSGVTYNYGTYGDQDFNPPKDDIFSISADRKTLTYDMANQDVASQGFRIFTENQATAVPEPETYLIMGSTLALVYFLAKRRKLQATKP